jgi:hypothetical protein
MSHAQAKFETYSKLPPGEWQLQSVSDSRAKALKDLATWLSANPTHMGRVVKEIYHPVRRVFFPLVIHEACGAQVGKEFREQKREISCISSDDMMRESARGIIRIAMGDWLAKKQVTVLEFLHRVDLVLEFKDAGYEMLGAQQRAAVDLSEKYDADPQFFMRQILKLCQGALEELLGDHRAGRLVALKGDILTFAAELENHERKERQFRIAISLSLGEFKHASDKLTRLISYAGKLADAGEEFGWALGVVDGFISDNIASAFGIDALAPQHFDAMATLDLLAEIVVAKPHGSRSPTALGGPLGARFFCDDLPESRRTLGVYCIQALAGLRRQPGLSLAEELQSTHAIANRLIACGPQIVDVAMIEDMQRRRERSLLNENWIDGFIRDTRYCSHPGHGLLILADLVQSEDGLKSLAGYLRGWLGSVDAERQFSPNNKELSLARRMALLAAMQRLVEASAFSDNDKAQLDFRIGALVSANLDRGAVLSKLVQEGTRDLPSAIKLLRMAASGQFPQGDVQQTLARTLGCVIARHKQTLSAQDQREVHYLMAMVAPAKSEGEAA